MLNTITPQTEEGDWTMVMEEEWKENTSIATRGN